MPEELTSHLAGLNFLIPEIVLGIGLLTVVLVDMIGGIKLNRISFALVLLIITASAIVTARFPSASDPILYGSLFPNEASTFFRFLADLAMILIMVFWKVSSKSKTEEANSEYPFLWLSVLFAVHVLVISNHWLMVYLSIEMISISSYILIGFGLQKKNFESAFKYLVFGALSSGIMIFGISLILASTGSLYFSGFSFSYQGVFENPDLLSIGLLMALGGVFFKMSLFPFHFWAPDAYQGASFPVMNMIASLPKIAAFGFLASQFLLIWPTGLFASGRFSLVIAFLAVLSITWGNLAALRQKNFARLFAYSGIAQSGFMLLALLNGFDGIIALEIYLSLYVLMNLIVFMTADQIFGKTADLGINGFNGFGKKHLAYAIFLTISMMALIGLPPTGGFTAKFVILTGVFEWYTSNSDSLRLLVFLLAVINVVISLFYYLKLPYAMFFAESEQKQIHIKRFSFSLIAFSALILLLSFLFFSEFESLIRYLGADII